jgi:prenyltransferase beta subunit
MRGPSRVYLLLAMLLLVAAVSAQRTLTQEQYKMITTLTRGLPSGGFVNKAGSKNATMENSYSAFVLDFFSGQGILRRSNLAFLNSMQNEDGGFGALPGAASDLKSTREAYMSLYLYEQNLPEQALAYLESLRDPPTGLYRPAPGAAPSLPATYDALVAATLVVSNRTIGRTMPTSELLPEEHKAKLRAYLKEHFTPEGFKGDFEPYSKLEGTLAGIAVASAVGYDYEGKAEELADYIISLQDFTGGGFAPERDADATLRDTQAAVISLHLLRRFLGVHPHSWTERVQIPPLRRFLDSSCRDLVSMAKATVALAFGAPYDMWYGEGVFNPPQKDWFVMQGYQLEPGYTLGYAISQKPSPKRKDVAITGFFKFPNGTVVSGLMSEFREDAWFLPKMEIDTNQFFGTLGLYYEIRLFLPFYGSLFTNHTMEKSIGYVIKLEAEAIQENNRKVVKQEGSIYAGVNFVFDLTLSTKEHLDYLNGPFNVSMVVRDSSAALVDEIFQNRKGRTDDIVFRYNIPRDTSLPAGAVSFRFTVHDHASGIAHSTYRTHYFLRSTMVASDIEINGLPFAPNTPYETMTGVWLNISMLPGTLPVGTKPVVPLQRKDLTGAPVARGFIAEIRSVGSDADVSVSHGGVHTETGRVLFRFFVENRQSWLTPLHVTMKYTPGGETASNFPCKLFDSAKQEIFEKDQLLRITVQPPAPACKSGEEGCQQKPSSTVHEEL